MALNIQSRKAKKVYFDVPCIIRDDLKEDWQVEEQLIADNLLRRHLTDPQRGDIGKYLEPIEEERAKQRYEATLLKKVKRDFNLMLY